MIKHIIFVVFFLVRGEDGINRNQLQYLIGKTRAAYRQIGIDIRPTRIILLRRDPSYKFGKVPYDYHLRANYWREWINRHYKNISPRSHRHITLPPVKYNNQRWFYGVAAGLCSVRWGTTASIGIATFMGENPIAQRKKSAIVMIHELAHELGASHDDSSHNYMHSSAPDFWNEPLRFSELSKFQMEECL